jgi:hypothetical protein
MFRWSIGWVNCHYCWWHLAHRTYSPFKGGLGWHFTQGLVGYLAQSLGGIADRRLLLRRLFGLITPLILVSLWTNYPRIFSQAQALTF